MPKDKSKPSGNIIDENIVGQNRSNNRRTYISLFSSAGVGCHGFKENGFFCIATNELLPQRLNIQRINKKCVYDTGYICGDISNEDVKQRLFDEIEKWKANENLHQVDVVFATPPCQGMSTVNYKKKDEKPRNSLVVEAIKIIKQIHPKIFIFENVRAFMKTICRDLSGEDMSIGDSIFKNLSDLYNIHYKVINFKDFGVPSSRPRTIVIGTSKQLLNLSPLNLFPSKQKEITLREAIGDLPSLSFGERDVNDCLHFARIYPQHMERWIENIVEGQSAFENSDPSRIPHKTDSAGNIIQNRGAYMGNKYRRLFWDKPCACVTTRNDQLASQDTIHPQDNRVLSITELMRVMTIPKSFKWIDGELNNDYKTITLLKKQELNIRRCIGEAVPTSIISQIASKIITMLDFEDFIAKFKPSKIDEYKDDQRLMSNFYIDSYIREQLIVDANKSGSFYTSQYVVYDTIKSLSTEKSTIRILEPSVGLGAFLPQVASLFSDCEKVIIDCVEIDKEIIEYLRSLLKKTNLGSNIEVNLICDDFFNFDINNKYDFVVTNPPYGKTSKKYSNITGKAHKTNNLFALFLLKLFNVADDIACVIPKNFAIADEFYSVRKLYQNYSVVRICDFGVKFFEKVFVEIISIHFSNKKYSKTEVVNYNSNSIYTHPQGYIFHDKLWLLYRDSWFDSYIKKLKLDIFDFVRDRAITNQYLLDKGNYRVLRSKNIADDGSIINRNGYDKFINDISRFPIGKFLNSKSIIMPNFTYLTRATILPDNTIPNGSIAILIPKVEIRNIDLRIYSTAEFRRYYSIVKSFSKFTLNIDRCSIYYIGVENGI